MNPKFVQNDASVENPDFELRYVRDPEGHDWMYGFKHSENYDEVLRNMKALLAHNPRADQGIEGMQYVEFVPMSDRARQWIASNGWVEQPRGYGKVAVVAMMTRLKSAGLTLKRILV